MTIEIPPGANNGPEGGWEELLVARNGVVEAYYYQDTQAPYPMFVAAIRNTDFERRFGKLVYLEIVTTNLSQKQFLEVLGTLENIGSKISD